LLSAAAAAASSSAVFAVATASPAFAAESSVRVLAVRAVFAASARRMGPLQHLLGAAFVFLLLFLSLPLVLQAGDLYLKTGAASGIGGHGIFYLP